MPMNFNITEFNVRGEMKRFVTPERYNPISYLAQGAQGIVCRGWDEHKNKNVVIKHCIAPFSKVQHAKQFFREFVLSRIVNHRNVIKLEYAYTPESSPENFQNMYLIFEHMDMSLFHFRKFEARRFENEKGAEFIGIQMHQLLSAYQYLHQPNLRLIHRDSSSNNILIKKLPGHGYNFLLKLADLGMARQMPFWDDADLTKDIGTMPYRAPEICLQTNYGTAVDLWSCGCLLYEMITGKVLFPTQKQEQLPYHIVRMIPIKDEEFAQFSWSLQDNIFLKKIDWSLDLLSKELFQYGSAWNQQRINLQQFNALLHRLLTFNPSNRITAEEALNLPIWNYLSGCEFYRPNMFMEEVALPYQEEYGNVGSVDEWRERLFNRVIPLQAMIDTNNS